MNVMNYVINALQTIFEVGPTAKSTGFKVMQASRKQNEKFIEQYQKKKEEAQKNANDIRDQYVCTIDSNDDMI